MDTDKTTAGGAGAAIVFTAPLDSFGSPVDMFVAARDRLYCIAALIDAMETCADHSFRGEGEVEQATALMFAAQRGVAELTAECIAAIGHLSSEVA